MFKKPVSNWKTSSPLRSSDRKKLKNKTISLFNLSSQDADNLIPEGILSIKFTTHLNEPGLAYLAPETPNDPLWFSLGKGADLDSLIPTVYTLWKLPTLLPFLSTPKAVIPILSGGADLMIPGVIHCSDPSLVQGQLVSIRKFERADTDGTPVISPPLAVGRMAVSSDRLDQEKGKAVLVLHAWKDHLWELGSKGEVPPSVPLELEVGDQEEPKPEVEAEAEGEGENQGQGQGVEGKESPATEPEPELEPDSPHTSTTPTYTPDEITQLLRISLTHAISKSLSSLPPSSFPIPATILYTTYILPHRPYFPERVLWPSSMPEEPSSSSAEDDAPAVTPDPYSVTIKSSSHKSLSSFLKFAEKSSLITTKSPSKKQNNEILIVSVNAQHPDVIAHAQQTYSSSSSQSGSSSKSFVTIGEIEARAAKRNAREEKEKEERKLAEEEVEVVELYKPHLGSVKAVEGMGGSPSELYTSNQLRSLLNAYIAAKQLVNPHDQAYINLDELLAECVSSSKGDGGGKSSGKSGGGASGGRKVKSKSDGKEMEKRSNVEFMKRDELLKGIVDKMQPWRTEEEVGMVRLLPSMCAMLYDGGVADASVPFRSPLVPSSPSRPISSLLLFRFLLLLLLLTHPSPNSTSPSTRPRKGKLSPIQVIMKIRQGRKASTLITGFEPFGKVIGGMEPEDLAEDLRKICAGATSVSPIPGKSAANAGMEVLVQGKQSKAVVDYLIGKGVPKKWIEVKDLVGKK
ncbi:hypothetical protein GYMLUDRAFT_56467 [Collybiopsis luxurians FD-317 M1]|nr:hypothetical protein GYMLUDRAFT_56467 [Collybiopsis luxurians FD-317 M1]